MESLLLLTRLHLFNVIYIHQNIQNMQTTYMDIFENFKDHTYFYKIPQLCSLVSCLRNSAQENIV